MASGREVRLRGLGNARARLGGRSGALAGAPRFLGGLPLPCSMQGRCRPCPEGACYHPCMNRTDRLYALVEELRSRAPRMMRATELAERFEVSTRTIERD